MSSITANSPSPHFKFPSSGSPALHEGKDYFSFNSYNHGLQSPKPTTSTEDSMSKENQIRIPLDPKIDQQNLNMDKTGNVTHDFFNKDTPTMSKFHNKFDSLSSILTNGSDLTLVDNVQQRPKLPRVNDSTDTLSEIPLFRPPSLKFISSPINSNRHYGSITPSSATDSTFHSKLSSSSPHMTPTRPMVRHATSLSQDNTRFNLTRINKDLIYQLPKESSLISGENLIKLIDDSELSHQLESPNLIMIDVRPFGEYCKNHIKNSVNVCLSSTLLKRSSFGLRRCIDSLPAQDKSLFLSHLDIESSELHNTRFPTVVLYDSMTSSETKASLSISYTASKFIQDKDWNSDIYILEGGFTRFQQHYLSYLSNMEQFLQVHSQNGNNSLFSTITPESSPTSSINSISSLPLMPPTRANPGGKLTSSPILGRFVLPSPAPSVFKTRHNEELMTSRPDNSLSLLESSLSSEERDQLPTWILNTIGNDHGCSSIAKKFNYLEKTERDRLRKVFSTCQKDDDTPEISSGVELGNKNRYKDILPYEHSRVKLKESGCDYINASYISSDQSSNRYIATQGPLYGTIGDFWSLVVSHKSPLILSLTAQSEGGVEKCAPFWEAGLYHESSNVIKVELLEQNDNFMMNENSQTPAILRRLKISINDTIVHEILQLQIISWPDYGVCVDREDLLSLVGLKQSLLETTGLQDYPIIVHCSAGCGRTGTFCAIDSIIDMLSSNEVQRCDNVDPISQIVESFRRQRISMVQTIRQYLLIYDTVLLFMKKKLNNTNNKNNNYDDFWDKRVFNMALQGVTHKEIQGETHNTKTNNTNQNSDILSHFISDMRQV